MTRGASKLSFFQHTDTGIPIEARKKLSIACVKRVFSSKQHPTHCFVEPSRQTAKYLQLIAIVLLDCMMELILGLFLELYRDAKRLLCKMEDGIS